jgi:hypothetical protein
VNLSNVPWITKEGFFDPGKLPLESVLQQAVGEEEKQIRGAIRTLALMRHYGRPEAGIFLMGLLWTCGDNWERRVEIVEALQEEKTSACVALLLGELKRLKSSNTTRRYFAQILKTLSVLPADLVSPGLTLLAEDTSFTPKMRAKFEDLLWHLGPDGRSFF